MNLADMMSRVVSHVSASGVVDSVNKHEPKAAPGNGVTAAVWVQSVGPVAAESGLAATTARVEFSVRIYSSMLSVPQDAIDPAIMRAVDVLMAAYSGDFTLGDTIRSVDLLGQTGTPLSGDAGYLVVDKTMYRVFTITLPLIVNDAYEQTP